jgi:SAM-dependent methyltransferase
VSGLSADELADLFRLKHGNPNDTGWAPRRRFSAGYFTPADIYEATVRRLARGGASWLDVGGGSSLFPENPRLAKELVAECSRVVAVDPSDNVAKNPDVHERVQSRLEAYRADAPFDLATMRMVVEHVDNPEAFVQALGRAIKPGGRAVVFTVYRWAPLTVLSRAIPFRFHYPLKRLVWNGEEEDTFPVEYKMNTRTTLHRLFSGNGFVEESFASLDDLSLFGDRRVLNLLELTLWKALRGMGVGYPERCLLGVYRRTASSAQTTRTP